MFTRASLSTSCWSLEVPLLYCRLQIYSCGESYFLLLAEFLYFFSWNPQVLLLGWGTFCLSSPYLLILVGDPRGEESPVSAFLLGAWVRLLSPLVRHGPVGRDVLFFCATFASVPGLYFS